MPDPSATCKHSACEKPADGGKGYCRRHYAAWKRGELPKGRYKTCRCEEHFARDHPGKGAARGAAPSEPAPSA
jgi:hypothetical protein